MRRSGAPLLAVLLCLSAGTARGHIRLMEPAPRHAQLKAGPCGAGDGDVRGDVVSTYPPGATITVRWQETVPHPGYYRISFDDEGQDIFVDPPAPGEASDDPSVLVDLIADKDGTGTYEQEVTLPDILCDRCTLQVIQVMTDKAPYGDGNDLYYQCADLVLSDDAPPTGASGTGDPADDGACACRGGSPAGAFGLFFFALLLRRRRSRT